MNSLLVVFVLGWILGGLPASGTDTGAAVKQEGKQAGNVAFRWSFGAMVGKDKKFVPITKDTVLKTGDEIKMMVELKENCYVYVIYHSSKGEIGLLFPEDLRQFSGDYKAGKNYYIPSGRRWFELDKNIGRETFYLLASTERLLDLEASIGNYKAADDSKKPSYADQILGEIRTVKRKFRTFTTLAERPVTIGGNIRGVEKQEESKRPDISTVATEITANNFYSKTFTIDHQ